MTLNDDRDNGTLRDFPSPDLDFSATSFRQPRPSRNPRDIRIFHDMLDGEIDSDPQISDSELSWQSVTDVDSLTATNHWRGWKQQATNTSATTILNNSSIHSSLGNSTIQNESDDRIGTLVELSVKTIARHIPFELVERYRQPEQPVPENLQLKIAFWSFPDGIEDIR